jgi:BASS family bile acid:Na+ symporter
VETETAAPEGWRRQVAGQEDLLLGAPQRLALMGFQPTALPLFGVAKDAVRSMALVRMAIWQPASAALLAFGSAELYGLGALFAVGLVIMGAAPGGVMANLLTHVAKGETALSVTMTAVSSVVAVVTVPLYLKLAVDWFDAGIGDDVSMIGTVARVFAITLIPLAIGMTVRARRPERAIALEPRFKRISLGVFVLVVIAAVASEWEKVTESFGTVAPAALTLNVAAMSLSFLISRAARLPDRSSTAIALELGLHNSTLTIAVATTIDTELAIPAAVYSAFMFLTAVPFALFMSRRNGPLPAPAAA